MENVSSDQLKALLAGELSTEQESAIENALERDAVLLDRLERLSGSGHWLKGGAAVPIEIISPSLQSAIERVVSESGIERLSTDQSESEVIDLDVSKSDGTSSNESLQFAIAVPGIRIVRELGRGGMGIVYEGWDEHVGRKVAIKQLLPMRGSAQNAKKRLLQEARAAGSLLRKDRTKRISSASELIAALQLQSPPRVQSTAMRTRAMLVSGVGLIAVCAILFSWFQGGKDLSSDNPRTGKAASTNASAGISADGFVPSKSLWIRRDASEYDSLTDAIDSAEDGDVIEIGTDLECEPITIRDKKLTLRGAGNVRPVIRSANQKSISENSDAYFIRTEADLTLEGIEINWVASVQIPFFDERKLNAVVGAAPGTRLVIDRCKIVRSAGGICLATGGHLEMRRTTIEGANVALAWFGHHSQALVEDSVLESRVGIAVIYPLANAAVYTRSNLKLRHCTIRAVDAISAMLSRRPDEPVSIQMQDTIFDAGHAVSLMSISMTVRDHIESQPIAALKSCIEINESRCVYDNKCDFLISRRVKLIERVNRTRVSNLDQWLALPSNSDSAEGTQSIVAKIIRISRESGAPNQNQYRFESSSVDPLPIWIDQIGPTSTSPATP